MLLRHEHRARVVEDRLDDTDDVDRVVLRVRARRGACALVRRGVDLRRVTAGGGVVVGTQHVEDGEGERCERLVEREVVLQVDGEVDLAPVGLRFVETPDDARGQHLAVEADCAASKFRLPLAILVVVAHEIAHGDERVAVAGDEVEQHRVRDAHATDERFGLARDDALEALLAPVDETLRRLLALHLLELLRVVTGLRDVACVLDDVLGRLDDHGAARVEPRTAGPPGDLVELARLEHALAGAVELRQAGEHDGADRHVDAHAERVGAADDLEQTGLRERLDQAAVLRQHAGVVHTDAVTDES